jgi:hypothetical protein
MGEKFEFGEPREKKIEKIDYEKPGLENLEIEEPVLGKDVFRKAKNIRAKELQAKHAAFYKGEHCEAEKVNAPFIFLRGKR